MPISGRPDIPGITGGFCLICIEGPGGAPRGGIPFLLFITPCINPPNPGLFWLMELTAA